jgi:hypothetical protein
VCCTGYGNISPQSAAGQVAVVFYALVGIPLGVILLSMLGSYMAVAMQLFFTKKKPVSE